MVYVTWYVVVCVVLFVIRVVLLLIVMFCVLFMCKCVLPPGVNTIAVEKYININIRHIIYDIWYMIYDIFVDCNLVDTRWQQYSTHVHTNSTQNSTINLEECWPCHRLYELYPGICLTAEGKKWKNLSQGSRRVPVGTMETEYTEQNIKYRPQEVRSKSFPVYHSPISQIIDCT
jgi:hypothetical protein